MLHFFGIFVYIVAFLSYSYFRSVNPSLACFQALCASVCLSVPLSLCVCYFVSIDVCVTLSRCLCYFVSMSVSMCDSMSVCLLVGFPFCRCFMDSLSLFNSIAAVSKHMDQRPLKANTSIGNECLVC